ncbi:protein of unknown function DUF1555 [Thermodesulfatator indicus DSM 15286]|uniref:PEP-CTERM protein-sorting domain-containing protein n=1 Tax=Thermodesulfatator indicus (strain DSM 15286 / JCM 11887 / CIR29812) TaxID=667014 RepID=F8ABT4_THEID|nr:PEP-CTERM sorting domain-containing protein [Thermodesulfatator indicus]AEH44537.1 protein of unknown function DUF1555 [Thermodesulfatator indicus DSM 15286]
MKKGILGLVFGLVLCLVLPLSVQAVIINGSFETGDLTGWAAGGQAGVQSSVVFEGLYAAWIGTVDFNDDDTNDFTGEGGTEGYTNNWISQIINVSGMASLSLYYNYYTWDFAGWDEPGFEIQINGNPVLSINAGDIDTTGDETSLDFTGWQLFTYDLTNYPFDTLTLTIYAGNTGDDIIQSWVYIDAVRLNPIPEPSSILLLALAGGSLLAYRLRHKK